MSSSALYPVLDDETPDASGTAPTAESAPGATGTPVEEKAVAVSALADSLGRVMRAMQRAKAHFLAHDESGTDWSAHVVLARIVLDGPQRVSALAEAVHSDVSTISRQVAAMVKEGLLERQADPQDGRASLLVVTDRGRDAVAAFRRHRDHAFTEMLFDWSIEDLDTLASLLGRFAGRVQDNVPTTTSIAPLGVATSREEN